MIFSCHPCRAHNLQSLYLLRRSLRSPVSSPSSVQSKTRCPRLRVSHLAPCQSPLLPLCFQQLPTIKFSNSFLLTTIQNGGGVWVPPLPLRTSAFLSTSASSFSFSSAEYPFFRIFFQVPYTLSPLFATLAKTAGVYGVSSQFGTGPEPNADRRGATSRILGQQPGYPALRLLRR